MIFSTLLFCFILKTNLGFEIIGPRCIPLVSKNIKSNPYHPALLSIPDRHIRNGFGLPSLTDLKDGTEMPSTKCPDFKACKMTVVKSFSTSIINIVR